MFRQSLRLRMHSKRSQRIYLRLSHRLSANRTGSFSNRIARSRKRMKAAFKMSREEKYILKIFYRVTVCPRLIPCLKVDTTKISATCQPSKSILILITYHRPTTRRFPRKDVFPARFVNHICFFNRGINDI